MIAGWERGMEGACAGEKITLIVPPELAYGDSPSDKVSCPKETVHNNFLSIFTTFLMSTCCEVAPGSTLYFLTSLNGIVRVTKQTTGKESAFTGGKKIADNLYPITKLEACDGSQITKKTRGEKINYYTCTQWNYNLLTVHPDIGQGIRSPSPPPRKM